MKEDKRSSLQACSIFDFDGILMLFIIVGVEPSVYIMVL